MPLPFGIKIYNPSFAILKLVTAVVFHVVYAFTSYTVMLQIIYLPNKDSS